LVGLVLALGGKDSRPRVLAAAFLRYYLVVGASPLVFARYALPRAMLQCVLGVAALHWLSVRTLKARWAWITAIAIVAGPSAYASLRVADILCATDTRAEAVDWIEAHVPPGARLCNFGSWSADPPLVMVTGIWWQVRRYVQQQGMEDLTALLPTFEGIALPRPAYEYALQPGWQHYEAGNLHVIDEFQCDYVLTNSHPLFSVRLDSTFLQQLPETARQVAWFTPTGWGPQQLTTSPLLLSARFVRRDPKFISGRSMPPGPNHREIGRRLSSTVGLGISATRTDAEWRPALATVLSVGSGERTALARDGPLYSKRAAGSDTSGRQFPSRPESRPRTFEGASAAGISPVTEIWTSSAITVQHTVTITPYMS
jgi:hypothetical protein